MLGVGVALRPSPVSALPAVDAAATAAAWHDVLHRTASISGPALILGRADCPCDDEARRTILAWARAENLLMRETTLLSGIALADAAGRLRYAGDPAALTVHCGGLRGFRAWWSAPAEAAVVTPPCACT